MVCGVCDDSEEVKKVDGVAIVLKDYEERRTTDVLYLLILIATWVAMTILGAISIQNGDINRLINPYNNEGQFCGVTEAVEDKPYMYYVSLKTGMGNCVKSCPTETADATEGTGMGIDVPKANYECVASLTALNQAAFTTYMKASCNSDLTTDGYAFSQGSECWCALKKASTPYFMRCVDNSISINDQNPTSEDRMKMFMADCITARGVIFGFGFGMALLFAFTYTYLMSVNCLAWLIVWSCVTSVLLFGLVIVFFGKNTLDEWKAEDPQIHSDNQRTWLQVFNYTFMSLCVIWFLLMMWFCKAINMAIKCVSMGAKALEEMPMMIFIPLVQIAGLVLFMVPWMYYSLYIASDGEFTFSPVVPTPLAPVGAIQYGMWKPDHNDKVGLKLAYMLFVLFWTMNFISNCGSLVIAHAVSCWYFTKPDERKETIGNHNLWASYKLVFRFHLGTVAFGSFLIALVQYARAVALYIQSHVSNEFREKTWVKIVFCCINCCLCCLETCMKFIAKNAYIQTAIYGTPFCKSAVNVFHLIANNIMRIGAIMLTSDGALFIGKIFVTVLSTGSSYMFISNYFDQVSGATLYEPVGPTIMVAIISWMTATMFMDVLHMSIDTIFQCFISDEASNNGIAAFAGDDMKSFVDEHGKMEDPNTKESELANTK